MPVDQFRKLRDPVKVMIVGDSTVVRMLLPDAVSEDPDISVVGSAGDPMAAGDLILKLEPDVIIFDIETPGIDGLSFLDRIMAARPVPVIIVSSTTAVGTAASVEALRRGAVDVIAKPGGPGAVAAVAGQLKRRIKALKNGPPFRFATPIATPLASPAPAPTSSGLILIGASTGGAPAIEALLTRMPANVSPILIVQHMPPLFTKAFAERLDKICPMRVVEAAGNEFIEPGVAYIAPGDHHLLVERHGLKLKTALKDGPPVHYQRPAVDVLFHSAARLQGVPMVAAILTGMGHDGADGLLALKQAGAETLAEDEQSCVVFGMPKEAIARGAAKQVVTLFHMPTKILDSLDRKALVAVR